jgi:uncharacterized alkaline shock family protein YloU
MELSSPRGQITISEGVIAQIAARTVGECYGVVGMFPRSGRRVARLLPRNRALQGVAVNRQNGAVALDLHVVVEHGLNLAEVASTVRSRVGYEVERLTGLSVASVDVHVQDVRRSA